MNEKSKKDKSRREAREKVEERVGREYIRSKYVHHIDRDPLNNEEKNLMVVGRSEHQWIHTKELKDWKERLNGQSYVIRDLIRRHNEKVGENKKESTG